VPEISRTKKPFTATVAEKMRGCRRRAILERFRTDHGGKRIALLGQHHIIALLAPGKQEIFREFLKP
jgi:hypothetical protein